MDPGLNLHLVFAQCIGKERETDLLLPMESSCRLDRVCRLPHKKSSKFQCQSVLHSFCNQPNWILWVNSWHDILNRWATALLEASSFWWTSNWTWMDLNNFSRKQKTVECIESNSYTEHFMQLHYNMQQHNIRHPGSQQLHLSAEIHSSIGDAARWPSWPLTSGRTSFRETLPVCQNPGT